MDIVIWFDKDVVTEGLCFPLVNGIGVVFRCMFLCLVTFLI